MIHGHSKKSQYKRFGNNKVVEHTIYSHVQIITSQIKMRDEINYSNVNGCLQGGIVRRTLTNVLRPRATTEAAASTKSLDTDVTARRSSSVTRVHITYATATNRRA